MTALAYLLPPVTGLAAYLKGGTPRARWHGLQSIALGVVWPAALYVCSVVSTAATQVAAVAGAAVWALFLVGAIAGRDPSFPGLGPRLKVLAEDPPSGPSSDV